MVLAAPVPAGGATSSGAAGPGIAPPAGTILSEKEAPGSICGGRIAEGMSPPRPVSGVFSKPASGRPTCAMPVTMRSDVATAVGSAAPDTTTPGALAPACGRLNGEGLSPARPVASNSVEGDEPRSASGDAGSGTGRDGSKPGMPSAPDGRARIPVPSGPAVVCTKLSSANTLAPPPAPTTSFARSPLVCAWFCGAAADSVPASRFTPA